MAYDPTDLDDYDPDLISWIKEEMKREIDKLFLEEVLGPAVFGEGNFELYLNENRTWCVKAAEGLEPPNLVGLVEALIVESKVSVNDVRRAMGLPEFRKES